MIQMSHILVLSQADFIQRQLTPRLEGASAAGVAERWRALFSRRSSPHA